MSQNDGLLQVNSSEHLITYFIWFWSHISWFMNMNLPAWCCYLLRCKDSSKLYTPECAYFSGMCATKRIQMSLHIWLEDWDEGVNGVVAPEAGAETRGLVWALECFLYFVKGQFWQQTELVKFTEKRILENHGITFVRNILVQTPRWMRLARRYLLRTCCASQGPVFLVLTLCPCC